MKLILHNMQCFSRPAIRHCILLLLVNILYSSPVLGANVALYVTGGAKSEAILALCRSINASGHRVLGIGIEDIRSGRLTSSNFDILILPPGQDGTYSYYSNESYGLGAASILSSIQRFVATGGGFIGIEAGAQFASTFFLLNLYGGSYLPWTNIEGGYSYSIIDPTFGSGTQDLFLSETGGYFAQPLPLGATPILANSLGSISAVRTHFGSGRVVLTAPNPSLRGDSELDWTQWDNWAMGDIHSNSLGAWQLFGRMIDWVIGGSGALPVISSENPGGQKVAVTTSYVSTSSGSYGGAWPGLIPAIGKAIEYSGHVPLSIRFKDIKAGRLTVANFGAVVFPGGNSTGYESGLRGYEGKVQSFVNNGGNYFGICAGSFYASSNYNWEGVIYNPALDLFPGQDIGPFEDLSEDPDPYGHEWIYYTLTPIKIEDPVLGTIGTQKQFYFGGGYKTDVTGVDKVALYAGPGDSNGKTDAIRFTYGSGRVLLSGAHPEARSGSDLDWLFWDNYLHGSTVSLTNSDNPWLFIDAVLNKWFFPLPGDLNSDGSVDLLDIVLGLQTFSGADNNGVVEESDLDGDGIIGLSDIIAAIDLLAD